MVVNNDYHAASKLSSITKITNHESGNKKQMSTQTFSERLVTAEAAYARTSPTSGDASLDNRIIVHVSSPAAFAAAHIPGAVLLSPQDLTLGAPPAPGKLPPPERLAVALQQIGYTPDKELWLYDDEGGGWAGRLAWTLDVIGHDNWFYIDGGLHAWAGANLPMAQGASEPTPASNAPTLSYNSALIADCDDLIETVQRQEITKEPTTDTPLCIWDARSPAEHTGERTGSARAGRIPGSHNLDWLEVMDSERHFRLRLDLPELLASRGIHPTAKLVVHCQTHHRSGLAYLAARLLNYPNVQGYDGSWAEWGNRTDTPIVTGPTDGAAT